MTTQTDLKLDAIGEHMAATKPDLTKLVTQRILIRLNYDNGYLDGIYLGDIGKEARNVIGLAVRTLMKRRVIEKTGLYRKSSRKESNGRVVWQYRLVA